MHYRTQDFLTLIRIYATRSCKPPNARTTAARHPGLVRGVVLYHIDISPATTRAADALCPQKSTLASCGLYSCRLPQLTGTSNQDGQKTAARRHRNGSDRIHNALQGQLARHASGGGAPRGGNPLF